MVIIYPVFRMTSMHFPADHADLLRRGPDLRDLHADRTTGAGGTMRSIRAAGATEDANPSGADANP